MSRKGPQKNELPSGDPVFDSIMVQRFINKMMYDGKKSVAEGIFYGALTRIEETSGKNPLEVFRNRDAQRNARCRSALAPRWWRDLSSAAGSAP